MLTKLIAGYIENQFGSSVSVQFKDSFIGGESFDEQNINALKYIQECVKDILDAEILAANSELQEYYDNLQDYLKSRQKQ